MSYNKPDSLEYIFNQKYDPDNPQDEIPFTRDDVREAIIATGGEVPDNLNNFVKDLVRRGNPDPRSVSSRNAGYYLREGTHTSSMGIFFKHEGLEDPAIAVVCPEDLSPQIIQSIMPTETYDLLRPDEGGLVAVLEYCYVLDGFFDVPKGTVKRVQSPVKIQPHELDSFFVIQDDDERIPIPCEVKSQGGDVITLNQIVGVAAATLQRLLEPDMSGVIPMGAKIEDNGDIFLVRFPKCTLDDLLHLREKIRADTVTHTARYRLEPLPPKWI